MNPIETLRARLDEIDAELQTIHETAGDDPLDEETTKRFEGLADERDETRKKIVREEKRAEIVAGLARGTLTEEPAEKPVEQFHVRKAVDDPFDLSKIQRDFDSPEAARHGLVERSRRVIGDDKGAFAAIEDRYREEAEHKVRSVKPFAGYTVAEHLLRTSAPAYISGWAKSMSPNRDLMLTDEERAAIRDANFRHMQVAEHERDAATFGSREARAASTTSGSGGLLMPTVLDPTVLYSGDGHTNPYREISTVRSVINDNGITVPQSGGVTGSWDTEGSEASDDAPSFANTQITPYKGVVFVPGSIEIFDDVPTLVETVGRMILREKDRMEEAAFSTGTGSNQPTGAVTALIGGPNYTAMGTNSAFAIGDLFTASEALGAEYVRDAKWVMNRVHLNDVREMGGTSYYTRTVTLNSLSVGDVLGAPTYESSTLSSTLDGDTNNNILYGDFSNYWIVDRIGMRTEFIPHLFATGNNRPSGQRGIYAYWRVGADSVNDTGFVLLYNPST